MAGLKLRVLYYSYQTGWNSVAFSTRKVAIHLFLRNDSRGVFYGFVRVVIAGKHRAIPQPYFKMFAGWATTFSPFYP